MRYVFAIVLGVGIATRAQAGDAASFAWASSSVQKSAAFAWATACEYGNGDNPDGLKWVAAAVGDANFGKALYLVKPAKCHGTFCTRESVVGAWSVVDQIYRPFDGKAWGKPAKPPISRPQLGER